MSQPTAEVIVPSKISEVRAFLKAQRELDELREQNPGVFRKLVAIAEAYNATLAAADAVVRARGVSCGPFELYSYVPTFSAGALVEAVGRVDFERFGGSITTVEKLALNRTVFESMVAQKKLPEEVADQVVTWGPRYHAPKPIALP